jgi:hypothetical protein
MLFTIGIILFVLWLVGLVSSWAIGAFVHLLLIAAIVLFILGFVTRGRAAV